jgi:hypothetical protein
MLSHVFSNLAFSFRHFWQRPFSWMAFGTIVLAFISLSSSLLFTPNFFIQSLSALTAQGLFPVFFFAVYHLNAAQISKPGRTMWLTFFDWLAIPYLRRAALLLFVTHAAFYFLLALLTFTINSIESLGPRVALLTHFILSTAFLFLTWTLPARLHYEPEVSLRLHLMNAMSRAKRMALRTSVFLFFVHLPLMIVIGGAAHLIHVLQTAPSATILPEQLPIFLLQHAPIGIHSVFFGLLFQLFFWFLFVVQNYTPELYPNSNQSPPVLC